MKALILVLMLSVDRPDLCGVFLKRVEVDHPIEYDGMKLAASRVALGLRGNGAVEPEFWIWTEHFRFVTRRRKAKIHMLMPLRNAERDALI